MKKIPKLSNYFHLEHDGTEVEALPEHSTEPETQPEMNAPRETSADEDSDESKCGSYLVYHDHSSPSSGLGHSNDLVENPTEMEEQPSGNSQVLVLKDLECSDPALWPSVLTDEYRKLFVEKGPCRIKHYEYPTDENGRRFMEWHYDRYLSNGETINRVWLVYSPSTNRVFCYCCKLFRSNEKIALGTEGLCDWKNISSRLNEHEVSKKHLEYMQN